MEKGCPNCKHEQCPNCAKCHNPYCAIKAEPLKACFDRLLKSPTPPTEDRDWKKRLKDALHLEVKSRYGKGVLDLRDLEATQKVQNDLVDLQWKCIEPKIEAEITTAEARGLDQAASVVESWHIKNGGYTELAHVIRSFIK